MVATTTTSGIYSELQIIRNFDALKDHLTMFTPEDLEKIESFTKGFHFLGWDLLATPQHGWVCQYAVADPRPVLCVLLWVPAVYVPHPEKDQRTEPATAA